MNNIIIDNSGCEFLNKSNGACEKCKEVAKCNETHCALKEYYILAAQRGLPTISKITSSEATEELVKIQKQIIKELNCTQTFPGQCHCAFRCLSNDFCQDAEDKIDKFKKMLKSIQIICLENISYRRYGYHFEPTKATRVLERILEETKET